jgi:hypothetical protein
VMAGGAVGGLVACSGGVVTLGAEEGDGGPIGSHDSGVLDATVDAGRDAPGLRDAPTNDSPADAGPDSSPPHCPTAAPLPGSACTTPGLECEYGSSAAIACNKVATCTGGTWSYSATAPSGPCPTGGSCPAEYPLAEVKEACSPSGLVCSYSEGTCTCAKPTGPATTDASARWQCFDASAGCPTDRPLLGSTCTKPGQECNYGECADGVEVQCSGGTWREVMGGCPSSSIDP